ncbi:efflux RND transporter periplasmic adaptor subunit [Erythrobacter sp. T5W1-R]|uniref:efflux RND transporter periplasmic adaptor subunit n=1 Tax=Erythrobacter sp. T5W1-R TaxID=3101752 RepID=UPI002AFEF02B|nr:efflux RND transporter periplasmic adaptor subunit [Erythrobacter sp. T5W1-R]MEA1617433.1 efflux RND transporter periplasmic adaptor subunit [Erythrobacter sp. T5W1-R]
MTPHLIVRLAPLAVLAAMPACSSPPSEQAGNPASQADTAAGLAIESVAAREVDNVPLGSVPGTISLPPEARVAVTAPFSGAVVRVYVIEGQQVARGEALGLMRAAEPVQIGGDLARARSAAALAEARAKRLGQLADEGVIAQARADEAKAEWDQARASVTQFSKMASLGGVGADGTMTLRSPIAGRVAQVAVETGGGVDTVTAPFVVEAAGAYQIELQLPERLAQTVRPGMAVEIALGGEGVAPVGGKIIAVAPSLDPATRSVMARASIGGAPGVIAGRNVTVTILGNGRGIAVPDRAVTRIGDKDHVFVRKGKNWEPRAVTVASRGGGLAVISAGLAAGEVVAGSSVAELKAMNAE